MFESKMKLRDKIKELESTFEVRLKEVRLEEKEKMMEPKLSHVKELAVVSEQAALQKAIREEMEKRYDESAYKQLSNILKALIVKLPTLNIQELAVHSKSEKS